MPMINAMTQADLEMAIIADADLYARFDEARLLSGGYTRDEMIAIMQLWIEEGTEV